MYDARYLDCSESIIGKTIIGAEISEDKTELYLHTNEGTELIFGTEGDCCSTTWIEHMTTPKFPAKITGIDQVDMGEIEAPKDQYSECLQAYSTKFETDQGLLEVEYRNESNGYYGGRMFFMYEREALAE